MMPERFRPVGEGRSLPGGQVILEDGPDTQPFLLVRRRFPKRE